MLKNVGAFFGLSKAKSDQWKDMAQRKVQVSSHTYSAYNKYMSEINSEFLLSYQDRSMALYV